MGIYNILDQIIDEYVGVEPTESVQYTLWNGPQTDYASLDPDLRDSIADECGKHINNRLAFKDLSKDAQECIKQWELVLTEEGATNGEDNREYC